MSDILTPTPQADLVDPITSPPTDRPAATGASQSGAPARRSTRRTNRASGRRAWRSLTRGQGLVGVILVGTILLLGVLAPVLTPFDPNEQIPGANLLPPGAPYWLGTDEANRDLLTRTLYGIRINALVVFVAVPIGAIGGVLAGLLAAIGPRLDIVTQRVFDLILAFPTLILAIALTTVMGPGVFTIVVVIAAAEIPVFGRLVRSSVLSVRQQPYVEAARVVGAGRGWVLWRHILPNSLDPLIVQIALSMSVAVFVEGAMSFLGIGVRPPAPSLGSLIRDGARNVWEAPFFAAGPLVVVVALVLGFLLISQALAASRR